MSAIIECDGLTKRFGGVTAVDKATVAIQESTITAVIGPNGAGKTTLFNMLCGVLPPSAGRVRFLDEDITGWGTHRVAERGMARTFQNLELFADMSVRDNLLVGQHTRMRSGLLSGALRLPRHRHDEQVGRERAEQLLDQLDLRAFGHWSANALPYGLQRRVELARALAGSPRLLLLDEPMAGLSDAEASTVAEIVRAVVAAKDGPTVLLVEHHVETVMTLSDRVIVMNFGQVIADGTPGEVRANPEVITAYLGEEVA